MNRPVWQACVVLAAVLAGAATACAQKPADKPRVPPGVDPGGVAVAIIGTGIDYTRPEIAARLARDGEGEIIGWDFVDNDRRPYDGCREQLEPPCPNSFLSVLAKAPEPIRQIFLRISATSAQTMVQAVQTAAQTPARIVLFSGFPFPPLDFIREASRRHPQLFFVGVTSDIADSEGSNYVALRPQLPSGMAIGVAEVWAYQAAIAARAFPRLDGRGIKQALSPRAPSGDKP